MKRSLLFLICFFCLINCFSQNQNNTWYFGIYAGINFNTNPPSVLTNSGMIQDEAGATISDNNGNILFYTNGTNVYNRNNTMMPNGFGLLGHPSATQGALIIPKPGDCNIYYIFTVSDYTNNWGLNYSVVDLSLDGGMGDVVSKNNNLQNAVTERLTGVVKTNGIDYWVVSKRRGTDAFFSYSVTAAGVDMTPVISNAGPPSYVGSYIGIMRISPDRTKLCIAKHGIGTSQLFDFDDATGIISNAIPLPYSLNPYGVEFSPDNSKLYISESASTACGISQYNLLAGSATAIQNSLVFMPTPPSLYALKLGPDNKIYGSIADSSFVAVIDQPNELGTACNFIYRYIDISPAHCRAGLPNNINDYGTNNCSVCPTALAVSSGITICSNQIYQLPSGTIVSTSGIYHDTIRNSIGTCDSIITTINLSVFPVSYVNNSIQICSGQTYQLPSGTIVSAAGIYQDTVRSVNSCDSIITTVNLTVFPVSYANSSVQVCSGQTYQLPSGTIVSAAGIYQDTVRSVASCDSIITTLNLSVLPVGYVNSSVQLCSGQTYQLPSGAIISAAGIYIDTLISIAGCDSVITTSNVSILPVSYLNSAVQICSNQTYQLPSGAMVSAAGFYIDTLRSVNSCDSIINTIHVLVNNISSSTIIDSIYEGAPYILPSGQTIHTAGVYQTVLTNSLGCDSVITTTLTLKQRVAECITLKNAITPNGDGINDYWILYTYNCFKKLEVSVYNRYGSLVYHADDYKNDWNGKYKNKELPDGTYYYVLKVISFDGKEHLFKDNLTILR